MYIRYSVSCNANETFLCDDSTCILKSQVCDNHADCIDSTDEIGCDTTNMSSCSEFWEAGYRENGTYSLGINTMF